MPINEITPFRSSALERFDIVGTGIEHNTKSLGGRVFQWKLAIHGFLSSPIYGMSYIEYKDYTRSAQGSAGLPLNAFLEVLVHGGILALIFVLMIVRWAYKRMNSNNFDVILLLIIPLAILSVSFNVAVAKSFWVYLGIVTLDHHALGRILCVCFVKSIAALYRTSR